MSTSNPCWRCQRPMRPGATFCAACGAAQQPDDPDAAKRWQARIAPVDAPPSRGLSFLWLLAWPAAPLLFPAHLVAAGNRLRRHVRARAESPALASPRFIASPEGKAIAGRLARSAGRPASRGVLTALFCYLLIAVALGVLLLGPTFAPSRIRYDRALESILEADATRQTISITSPRQYDEVWSTLWWGYSRVKVEGYTATNVDVEQATRNAGVVWDNDDEDTPNNHRPYIYSERYSWSSTPQLKRASYITLEWDGSAGYGVVFYVLVGLLHVTFVILGLRFWLRFMRHLEAEALAAAYAKGDTAYHDRVMADVRRRNTLIGLAVIPLSIVGLHVALFPVLSAFAFAAHPDWERRHGIADALGIDRPAPAAPPVVEPRPAPAVS